MPSPYVTKSDFKACFDCRTKLFYRKGEYPSNLDENEYMQFLADGGFMVESIAKAQYPDGVDLVAERDPQRAFVRTQELIAARPDAVVFEAAVIWNKFYARVDVLRREGDTLHLIEVKSSSLNADDEEDEATSPFVSRKGKNKGKVSSKWQEYLLDVAFQARVLGNAFPKFKVKPWLCVVNKGHRVTANETMARFRVARDESNPKARPVVEYSGNVWELKGAPLLAFRDVSSETAMLMPEVEARADALAALLDSKGSVQRVQEPVAECYKTCRTCEYRFPPDRAPKLHGFAECWGPMAKAAPHILDLHRVTQIGSGDFPDPVPALLARGKASLLDLPEDQLGVEGSRQERRYLQWSHSTGQGKEFLQGALRNELKSHQKDPGWPLHFVDFEACDIALPHHASLRPYERVAFQWSCHTLYPLCGAIPRRCGVTLGLRNIWNSGPTGNPLIPTKRCLNCRSGTPTKLPHVRSREEPIAICLFMHEETCWNGNMLLGQIVIPMGYYWLASFEEWLFTGVWRGGGTHDIAIDPPQVAPVFPNDLGLLNVA